MLFKTKSVSKRSKVSKKLTHTLKISLIILLLSIIHAFFVTNTRLVDHLLIYFTDDVSKLSAIKIKEQEEKLKALRAGKKLIHPITVRDTVVNGVHLKIKPVEGVANLFIVKSSGEDTHLIHFKEFGEVVESVDPFPFPYLEIDSQNISDQIPGDEFVVWTFSGGVHCCASIYFFEVVPDRDIPLRLLGRLKYTSLPPSISYILEDLDGDGVSEIKYLVPRYAYTFTAFAFSRFPLQILELTPSGLVDVSKKYPDVINEYIEDLKGEVPKLIKEGGTCYGKTGYLLYGVVSAVVGNYHILGRDDLARAYYKEICGDYDSDDDPYYNQYGHFSIDSLLEFAEESKFTP